MEACFQVCCGHLINLTEGSDPGGSHPTLSSSPPCVSPHGDHSLDGLAPPSVLVRRMKVGGQWGRLGGPAGAQPAS